MNHTQNNSLSLTRPPPRAIQRLSTYAAFHPKTCLAFLLIATLALGSRWTSLELQTEGAALYPIGDSTVAQTNIDRSTFADPEELVLLLVAKPDGPTLTSLAGLQAIARVHAGMAAIDGIDGEAVRSVASLIDVATSGIGSLRGFLDTLPSDESERLSLLNRLREHPLANGLFLPPSGATAAVYLPLRDRENRAVIANRLQHILTSNSEPDFDLRLTGPLVAETLLGQRILQDLSHLVPLMVGLVAFLLFLCLRTRGGLLVALLNTLVVLIWTGGLMQLAGIPVTLVTTIVPVLLLALCVTDEVHVMARFQTLLQEDPYIGRQSGILDTLNELYRPILYTSLSTALGFLSFLTATVKPLNHFGTLAATGILLAMVFSFFLTPALVAVLPRTWFLPKARSSSGLTPLEGSILRHRKLALPAGILLLAVSAPGFFHLTLQDSWIDNFDPNSSVVKAERVFNQNLWGSYRYDLVLAGPSGFFQSSEGADLIQRALKITEQGPHVRGVVTYQQSLHLLAELLGINHSPTLHPDDHRALLQIAEDYSGQAGLHRLITTGGDSARILAIVNSPNYLKSKELAEYLTREMAELTKNSTVSWHGSGDIPLGLTTVKAVVHNQLRSIGWTLLGVGLMLYLVNRRIGLTLAQLIPSMIAAWLIFCGMGYTGIPLGIATSMFAAMTLGVGIDLALHVTYAHQDALSRGLTPSDAMYFALERTAQGRRWSTLVLALGFMALSFSAFRPNHYLGILMAAAMAAAYLATYLFVPRMLTWREHP